MSARPASWFVVVGIAATVLALADGGREVIVADFNFFGVRGVRANLLP